LYYYWDFGDNTSSTFVNPTHIYRAPGIYIVKFIVSDCYKSDTVVKSIEISSQTGIAEYISPVDFEIIPNPVTDFLQIQTTNETDKIEIFSALGWKVLETKWKEKIDISGLLPGVYFVRVGDRVLKFVKY
jgi:PKD repeat protein